MFSNPTRPDRNIDEGTIVQVDPNRSLCKVKTLNGQTLHSVQWLLPYGGSTRGADRYTPLVGDRAVVSHGLGYPIIIGFLPKIQVPDGATPLSINDGQEIVDMGNYSPEGSIVFGDQNKPKDSLLGDRIISSIGGSFLALLRGGSLILRATRGSEIFMSNLFNLVRIVSRNWEHFTDVCSDVVKNFKGRVYRYSGYSNTFTNAKIESYNLHFYYGDTPAAEAIKTNYALYSGTPATNDIIYKEQITDVYASAIREIMRRTIDLSGNQEFWIYNGTHFTRVSSTAEQLTLSWNDQNSVVITETSIHLFHKDGADAIMDSNGIRATFSNGEINMSSSSVVTTYGATTVALNSNGAYLSNGAGQASIEDALTQMSNNGHTVAISASGVAIT